MKEFTVQGHKMCDEIPECSRNPASFASSFYNKLTEQKILGIARDGHLIYTPFRK